MKILYVARYLKKYASENKPAKAQDIIDYLGEFGITAERKSIYDDVACLTKFGYDVNRKGGRSGGYYMNPEPLSIQDVKILADAVSVSRFLSQKKSEELINKLGELVAYHQRDEIKRRVHVMSRLKNPDEQIYESIDIIRNALQHRRSITFQYYEWVMERKGGRVMYVKRLRHRRKLYFAHPLALLWDDVNYYLVAYENASAEIRHYRLDRMHNLRIAEEDNPEGRRFALRFDPAIYSPTVFDMFSGEERNVVLLFKEDLLDAMIDRFGEDMIVEQTSDKKWYKTIQNIRLSDRFFAWVIGFGDQVRVDGPSEIVRAMRQFLRRVSDPYNINE